MAENKNKALIDILDGGAVPAESLNHYQNKLVGTGAQLEASLNQAAQLECGAVTASASEIVSFTAPYDLEILSIYAVSHGVTGNPTATFVNFDGTNSKNPIAGTNIDLGGLTTDHVPESETVSTTQANLEMKAGNNLRCTFAAGAGEAITAATATIIYRPIQATSF